ISVPWYWPCETSIHDAMITVAACTTSSGTVANPQLPWIASFEYPNTSAVGEMIPPRNGDNRTRRYVPSRFTTGSSEYWDVVSTVAAPSGDNVTVDADRRSYGARPTTRSP